MSAERVTYLDSSAIVKLAAKEPESAALRQVLRRRPRLAASALARTEAARALMEDGPLAVRRGREVLRTLNLMRVNNDVLTLAGELQPARTPMAASHSSGYRPTARARLWSGGHE